jgi:plasmid maintenance system antidote protein VapI
MLETFADILAELGVTQLQAADAVGLSRVTISKICNGHQKMSPEHALLMEAKYGVPAWRIRPDIWRQPAEPTPIPPRTESETHV